VRTTVEHDPAVGAEAVGEARRFAALLAEPALERRAKVLLPAFGVQYPRSGEERRLVADVLPMAAGELGDPLVPGVELEADDCALHRLSVRRA
jgi:hypothetical protein